MSMRELQDEQGHTWQVWEVHPGGLHVAAEESRLVRVRESLSGGWLAFACRETGARFRVAPPPSGWHGLADAALLQLGRAGETVVLPALAPEPLPQPAERGAAPT